MARRTLVTLAAWTPRGPAPSRGSGHGAQKVYAHTLHASACATAEVLVASQHAVSVPHRLAVCTDVDGRGDGSRLGRMEQRALSSCTRARDERRVGQSSGESSGRGGASEHGRVRVVLCARRGVWGDPTGPWPCHWHARITQGRRVGELEPELYFLAVSGQFHDLVKRTKNRLRGRRARSEERLVAPNPWPTLSVHVVASPGSRAALEVGGLTVHSFYLIKKVIERQVSVETNF